MRGTAGRVRWRLPALEVLYRASRGIPRTASHLLRAALVHAHDRDRNFVDEDTVLSPLATNSNSSPLSKINAKTDVRLTRSPARNVFRTPAYSVLHYSGRVAQLLSVQITPRTGVQFKRGHVQNGVPGH